MYDDLEAARREMEQAVLLPEDDPRRIAVASDAQRTDTLASLWGTVLSEHRDLGRRLRDVPVSEDLAERLRLIPRDAPRPARRYRHTRIASLVAVLTVALSAGWYMVAQSAGRRDEPVHALAMLAALDHSSDPALTVQTSDPSALASALAENAPFEIALRPPAAGAVLDGGRLCSFGTRPIVYTRWRTTDGDLALYQMEHRAFGIPPGLSPADIDTPRDGSPDSRCMVRVWSDERFAYVVVDDRRGRGPGG